ncbi:MAG: zinc-dependent dehydrogenase [Candidatus Bathyarchaeota archaeon]
MRVSRYYCNDDIRLEEMPVPKIGVGELLVRIEAAGICGSDVMEWYRIGKGPMVLGHEIAGEIVEVGAGVEHYKKGQRIIASHHVPCNTCHYCLTGHQTVCETLRKTSFDPGGFAEYVRLPAINVDRGVFLLADSVSFEEGTFTEPLACVFRGQKQAQIQPGSNMLIVGAGITGLLHVKLARAFGANRIIVTDINRFRLETALKIGADAALNASEDIPERVKVLNKGLLADIVIVCTSAKTAIIQALKSVERSGTILFFAPAGPDVSIPLSFNDLFWRNEVTLTSSYAGSPADHVAALSLIRSGTVQVKDLITHRLSLAETGVGFQLIVHPGNSIKVIIEPQR